MSGISPSHTFRSTICESTGRGKMLQMPRVVSLLPSATDTLVALHAEHMLLGRSHEVQSTLVSHSPLCSSQNPTSKRSGIFSWKYETALCTRRGCHCCQDLCWDVGRGFLQLGLIVPPCTTRGLGCFNEAHDVRLSDRRCVACIATSGNPGVCGYM